MEWVDLGMACIGCAAAPLIGALAVPLVFIKFPLEQLKIPKFSRLRRKKTPARYARRQGVGQLDYPDRHFSKYGEMG